MNKTSQKRYIQVFGLVVIALAIIRAIFPSVAQDSSRQPGSTEAIKDSVSAESVPTVEANTTEDIAPEAENVEENDADTAVKTPSRPNIKLSTTKFFNADGSLVKHRIFSVASFRDAFPDQNDVQLASAQKYGVTPVTDRAEAEQRKKELVYVGSNPYFYVDKLKNSIPYLVPRASYLLQSIGSNFFDSLQVKGIPLHKIIVTSVLRSKADVEKLRGHNGNATQNSCHLYGTTFDICYNRYKTVEDPDGPSRRKVTNDTLKWVLSEVLNDMRQNGQCHIKYEVKQGCFHITVK